MHQLGFGPGVSNALAAMPTGEVPDETAGPYPGDGSNGPDASNDHAALPGSPCTQGRLGTNGH